MRPPKPDLVHARIARQLERNLDITGPVLLSPTLAYNHRPFSLRRLTRHFGKTSYAVLNAFAIAHKPTKPSLRPRDIRAGQHFIGSRNTAQRRCKAAPAARLGYCNSNAPCSQLPNNMFLQRRPVARIQIIAQMCRNLLLELIQLCPISRRIVGQREGEIDSPAVESRRSRHIRRQWYVAFERLVYL